MNTTTTAQAIPDPAPWVHIDGTRVSEPGAPGAPEGGYTYRPRPGYSDHGDRYVSTDRRLGEAVQTPTCRSCGMEMVRRDPARLTYEQTWCGTWYDHPFTDDHHLANGLGHDASWLDPSPELLAQDAEFARAAEVK